MENPQNSSSAMLSEAAPPAGGQITGQGNANMTIQGTKSAINNFNVFCESKKYALMDDIEADVFCREEMMYEYSYWVVQVYLKESDDEPLMTRTTTQYIGRVMNEGRRRFGNTNGDFFRGLDDDAPVSHWYKKLLKNVERNCSRRAIDRGEKITDSPPPTGRDIIAAMALAYFSCGTQEAMLRRLLIVLIFLVAGRAGEVAASTWNLLSWDHTLKNLYFNWSQPKTSKQKGIGIVSDNDNHGTDIYKAFGDLFAMGYFRKVRFDPTDENNWMFPDWEFWHKEALGILAG
jgi:hypothetical protein